MTILQEILKNNKLSSGSYNDRDLYWENKVELVAKIAEESELINFDVEYWKKMPCAVLTLIYDLYTKAETVEAQEPKFKIGDSVYYFSTTYNYKGLLAKVIDYVDPEEYSYNVTVQYISSGRRMQYSECDLRKI